ncbi:hypothetical protein TNCV_123001 [Trichonephila clavipes]|nr:hypothetical protein TNCV_123001 [Trichonephila clavipes]
MNERRLVQGHETTPLRLKGDIEDVYNELDNGCQSREDIEYVLKALLLAMPNVESRVPVHVFTTVLDCDSKLEGFLSLACGPLYLQKK